MYIYIYIKKKKKNIKYIIFKITPFQFMDYKFYKKFHTNINYCIKPKQIIKEQFE